MVKQSSTDFMRDLDQNTNRFLEKVAIAASAFLAVVACAAGVWVGQHTHHLNAAKAKEKGRGSR